MLLTFISLQDKTSLLLSKFNPLPEGFVKGPCSLLTGASPGGQFVAETRRIHEH